MDILLFAVPMVAVLLLIGLALMAELEREETVAMTLPKPATLGTRGRVLALPTERRPDVGPASGRQPPSRRRRVAASSAHAR